MCTFVCVVKGGKGDDEEGGGVFPSVDQVREGPLGVAVTPQALDEPKPGRKTLDDCSHPIGVGVTHVSPCRGTGTHTPLQRVTFIHSPPFVRAEGSAHLSC